MIVYIYDFFDYDKHVRGGNMFQTLMHVSFYVKNMNKMKDFYENVLGAKVKMAVKYKAYLNQPGSGFYQGALTKPEDYCIVYFEIAPMQFIEFFPAYEGIEEHDVPFKHLGYSHFGVITEDIHALREELVSKGVHIDTEPKIGNSHTWQMWISDPEGNKIEFMQYTPESFQITGHIDE